MPWVRAKPSHCCLAAVVSDLKNESIVLMLLELLSIKAAASVFISWALGLCELRKTN